MDKRLVMSCVLLVSLLPTLNAQQPQQKPSPAPSAPQGPAPAPPKLPTPHDDDQDVVRITTNLVQIDAVVTKDGKQITDLKAEDFEIFEDGKPQTITQFSYVSNVPANPITEPVRRLDKNAPPTVPTAVRPNDVRRTFLLVVDDLGTSSESIHQVRRQLRKFVDEQLQPNDLVAIVNTGGSEVGALQQFTTDKRLLSNALEHLRWNPCSRVGSSIFRPAGPLGDAGPALCSMGTIDRTLQVLRFVLQGMRDLPGRKSMIVFSDNLPREKLDISAYAGGSPTLNGGPTRVDNSSRDVDPGIGGTGEKAAGASMVAQLHRIAELAIRASVVIYAVDSRGLMDTGITAADSFGSPGNTGSQTLEAQLGIVRTRSNLLTVGREGGQLIAIETGGFIVYNSNDLGLKRVMDDQQGYYLIGYRPQEETFDRRFHQIKVRARPHGLEVRTRTGFYGVTEEEATPPPLSARDSLNKALMSPFGANDIKLQLTAVFENDATRGTLLRSFLYLNARDLVFTDQPDGAHDATFNLSSVIFGDYGKVVNRVDELVRLRLKPARYEQVMREGIVYRFDRPIKQSGAFQFRVALHDTASSRIGAAGQFIEVPNLRNSRLALSGLLLSGAGNSANELSNGPAVRQFQQGSPLTLSYAVYNAIVDNRRQPQLTSQTRIFRDGKAVYAGPVTPIDLARQVDLQRIAAVTRLELGSEFSPGDYMLQIVVDDRLAKEKQGGVSQWIDFTVVN